MKILKLILPLALLSFFSSCTAQTGKKSLAEFIQHNADSIYQKENIPGIVVGILNNGERQFFTAGFANPDNKLPFDSATIFEIGSITKTFTAYVLMAVLMEHKIPESSSIIKYLPDSVQQNKKLEGISFLSLMNHTSGLPRLPGNMKMKNIRQPYENYKAEDLFNYLKNCTPKPDGKSNYSNLGAGLAGVLAERISKKSYASLLDQYIFIPFKMGKQNDPAQIKSIGYYGKDDKAEYWNMDVLAPAGGIRSSANEILTYLHNMSFPSTPVSKQIVDELTTQTVAITPGIGVGLGWHILNEKNLQPIYWHNGGTYGFSTFSAFTKDKSKAVIVVINQFNKNAFSDGAGIRIIKRLLSEE